MGKRRRNGIADNIIVAFGAERSRISEIIHLKWSNAARENRRPRTFRVAVKVHGDIDIQSAGEVHDFLIAFAVAVDHAIARGRDALARSARRGVASERKAGEVEARAVMRVQKAYDDVTDGVVAKIRRKIADADFSSRRNFGPRRASAKGIVKIERDGFFLLFGRGGREKQRKRPRNGFAFLNAPLS